jgi:hypothetical protein
MAAMKRVFQEEWLDTYNLKVYIETGLGDGSGIRHMSKFGFEDVYVTEILPERIQAMVGENLPVTYLEGDTVTMLGELLDGPLKDDPRNFLWFLDAHVGPGGMQGPEAVVAPALRLPQKDELLLMVDKRDVSRDVVIMDDVHLYPNWREFFNEILGDTHLVSGWLGKDGSIKKAQAFPKVTHGN